MRLRRLGSHAVLAATLSFGMSVAGAHAAKPHPLHLKNGIYTVDGLTAKTTVNLQIANLHFLYLYVPGSGTAIVSEKPFLGATEQKAAFRGNTLTVLAGSRHLQLTSATRLRGTRTAFVRFVPGAGPGTRFPAVSYGDAAEVPAIWPDETTGYRTPQLRLKVKGRRALRTARLCRPSPHGQELCATVREVTYKPY